MTDQTSYIRSISQLLSQRYPQGAKAYIRTYGCQQNVSDGEKFKGYALEMGYTLVESAEEADFVLYNTCAVRENAEDRVFGNLGALKHSKEKNPDMLIGVCGCMTQQEHIAAKIKKSYPHVDLIFGTHLLGEFPRLVFEALSDGKRVLDLSDRETDIPENLPVKREGNLKAWLPIMYGCNNFCTYCIVPHVRGRERSRKSACIVKEFTELVNSGYKEITLLGQNVNSYGKGLEENITFPQLLDRLASIPGDFRIRFMTSHPKDATRELLDVMAKHDKICKHFHLPVQCGSDNILKRMNRHYNTAQYLELIDYARSVMPDISFTSDIIVGFPGETRADFEGTLALIRRVEYDSLYTFIYSPRVGTPAATMPDPISPKEKSAWFRELLDAQNEIGPKSLQAYVGKTCRVLLDGKAKEEGKLTGRTDTNMVVDVEAEESLLGQFVSVKIINARNCALDGELVR